MSKTSTQLNKTSKFLSYILRHCPEYIDLQINNEGWVLISELIDKAPPDTLLSQDSIQEVVESCDKQRFKISEDGLKIRANQGHSIKVDLKLIPSPPPTELFHGTATRFLDLIKKEGLKPGQRQHVHLSTDPDIAKSAGQRYGNPVILSINSAEMFKQGFSFYLSENNVWLIKHIPSDYISEIVFRSVAHESKT